MEKLTECNRCGGNACYEQQVSEKVTTWICMGCGFTTSSELTEGSKLLQDILETSPELYKDLLFIDQSKKAWTPSTITLPGKGMVFIDGTTKENWAWAAVKAVRITDEERNLKQFPEDQVYKMDMSNAKHFGKKDFMDAIESIGFFEA